MGVLVGNARHSEESQDQERARHPLGLWVGGLDFAGPPPSPSLLSPRALGFRGLVPPSPPPAHPGDVYPRPRDHPRDCPRDWPRDRPRDRPYRLPRTRVTAPARVQGLQGYLT